MCQEAIDFEWLVAAHAVAMRTFVLWLLVALRQKCEKRPIHDRLGEVFVAFGCAHPFVRDACHGGGHGGAAIADG